MNVGTTVIFNQTGPLFVGFVCATHDSWVEDYSDYFAQPDSGKYTLQVFLLDGPAFRNNMVEGTDFYLPSVAIEAV